MKLSNIKTQPVIEYGENKLLKLQDFDKHNDYPNKLLELVKSSGTVTACIDVRAKFIRGEGFNENLENLIVNRKGQNINDILKLASYDVALFDGFCLHINYNEYLEVCEINYVPFESARLEKSDDIGFVNTVAIAKWYKKPRKGQIDYINTFNSNKQVIATQVEKAGGIKSYKGQILYVGNNGENTYPESICTGIIADISTEAAVSIVKNRNANNGFFPACLLVFHESTKENPDNEDGQSDHEFYTNEVRNLQGAENAMNTLVATIGNKDEMPEVKMISGENYDKAFELTEKTVQANIGKRFIQPPILRCENVSTGFDTDAMESAYKYYNSITKEDRVFVQRAFQKIIANYKYDIPKDIITINKLKYGSD